MCVNKTTLALTLNLILTVTLTLWSSFGACASKNKDCKYALTYLDAVRARGVVSAILPAQITDPVIGAELNRIDDLLIEMATEHLTHLGPSRRETFLHAFDGFKIDESQVVAGIYSVMSSGGPELERGVRGEPVVLVDPYARYSFLGRLQMMHQFVLVETAARGDPPAASKFAVYREAVQYYQDQYRFLHKAFTVDQADALIGMVPVFDERRKILLETADVLTLSTRGFGPGSFDSALAQKLGLGRELGAYLQEMANQRFLYEVRQAFQHDHEIWDEPSYVKFKISKNGYKRAQRQMVRAHNLRRAWDLLNLKR